MRMKMVHLVNYVAKSNKMIPRGRKFTKENVINP